MRAEFDGTTTDSLVSYVAVLYHTVAGCAPDGATFGYLLAAY